MQTESAAQKVDAGATQDLAPWTGTVLAVGGVTACWIAAVLAATRFHPVGLLHDVALFVHLVSLAVGFGAVLVLEVYGASSLFGRRAAATPRHGHLWARLGSGSPERHQGGP